MLTPYIRSFRLYGRSFRTWAMYEFCFVHAPCTNATSYLGKRDKKKGRDSGHSGHQKFVHAYLNSAIPTKFVHVKTLPRVRSGSYHVRHVQISNVPGTVQLALTRARNPVPQDLKVDSELEIACSSPDCKGPLEKARFMMISINI